MKKTELNGYVYGFTAGYDVIAVDGTLDIHQYFFSCNALKCISINSPECKARPEIIN